MSSVFDHYQGTVNQTVEKLRKSQERPSSKVFTMFITENGRLGFHSARKPVVKPASPEKVVEVKKDTEVIPRRGALRMRRADEVTSLIRVKMDNKERTALVENWKMLDKTAGKYGKVKKLEKGFERYDM
jgi:hypothetical protein